MFLFFQPQKPKDKKKAAKGKQSAVMDGLSTEDMSKDQLEEHIVRLREELDREREERSYFQLERDKIQAFWEISKRSLEETKAELKIGQREREEAEERHRVEITVYKQKLKHVLSEQHSTVSGLKMDVGTASSLIQNQNAVTELGLRGEVHSLQASYRKKMFHDENCIKELKLKQQVELMELTNDNDRRIRDMAVKFKNKMQSALEEHNRKKSAEILEVEERWKSHIVTLVEDHNRALLHAENLFSEAHNKELQQLKHKEELVEVKKKLVREERKLAAAGQENKRLQKCLQEAEQKLPQLQKQLEEHNKDRTEMLKTRARVKVIEKDLKDLSVEHELLLQAFEKVQQERDELLKKQTAAILDVQQLCGLKEMLLERKLAALTETLETKEAQLCAVLSASNIDQTVKKT
ncbi:dynein regulatory complex subunit 4-like isoform X1 [Labrus mixtus]|uniref:dynein regulatory complex subunit 4-like isoform X1 n=1 Tax=Labrus mixtus TaxID=508554 RepID=UPI0029C09722|nr:dynein regulatory complex subunit 4-like isoform X1 [Labrus mixtus]